MPKTKESARPLERPNAQTPEGATEMNPVDTSIVRQGLRLVKRFSALAACVALVLVIVMFAGAPLVGGMSWSASAALIGTACWLCATCYHMAGTEDKEEESK